MRAISTVFLSLALGVAASGQTEVTLSLQPRSATIHVAEPLTLKVVVKNAGTKPVKGIFVLDGSYDGLALEIRKPGTPNYDRFMDRKMSDGAKDDMLFNPTVLRPGSEVTAAYCLLYDVPSNAFAFSKPGEYDVRISFRWDPAVSNALSANARISVLDWDEKKEAKQREAMRIWMNMELADARQHGGPLKEKALKAAQELHRDYADTVYGKAASALLERRGQDEKGQPAPPPTPRAEVAEPRVAGKPVPAEQLKEIDALFDAFRKSEGADSILACFAPDAVIEGGSLDQYSKRVRREFEEVVRKGGRVTMTVDLREARLLENGQVKVRAMLQARREDKVLYEPKAVLFVVRKGDDGWQIVLKKREIRTPSKAPETVLPDKK